MKAAVLAPLAILASLCLAVALNASPDQQLPSPWFVQEGTSGRFSCFVPSTTTVTTQCQAAPAAGLRNYVTSVVLVNAVTTAQSIDLVTGTGTNCGTGTTALTAKWFWIGATETGNLNAAAAFTTPLVPPAATAICARPTAATAYGVSITGYTGP